MTAGNEPCEDAAQLVVSFDNGAIGSVHASWVGAAGPRHVADGLRHATATLHFDVRYAADVPAGGWREGADRAADGRRATRSTTSRASSVASAARGPAATGRGSAQRDRDRRRRLRVGAIGQTVRSADRARRRRGRVDHSDAARLPRRVRRTHRTGDRRARRRSKRARSTSRTPTRRSFSSCATCSACRAGFSLPVRHAIADRLGLDCRTSSLSCTHTHQGPSTIAGSEAIGWPTPDGLRGSSCVTAASRPRRQRAITRPPATLRYARAPLPDGFAFNRRGAAVRGAVVLDPRRPRRRRAHRARREPLDPSRPARPGLVQGRHRLGRPVPRTLEGDARRHGDRAHRLPRRHQPDAARRATRTTRTRRGRPPTQTQRLR